MRETYFVELLMKMVREGMSVPQFICSSGVELMVFEHEIVIAVPKCKVVDSDNATHEEPTGRTVISLTADQLSDILFVGKGLCKTVSDMESNSKDE